MGKFTYYIAAMALLFASGCTPLGESVAKKAENPTTISTLTGSNSANQGVEEDPATPLDPSTREIIRKYGPAIRQYAERYGMDWRLILAMIKQESRFSADAESRQGAYGLMQIMPVTEVEISRILDLNDLSHPRNNIRGGVFYLRKLYGIFSGADEADRLKLALAAYNAGLGRVYDAQEIATYLRDKPMKWESVRDALPLLSRRYHTLHMSVWQQDRPRSGWFGNARQTILYVDAVMNYYDDYRLYLN